MNCGRGVAFFGAEAISKSDRFPGANCGRKAALRAFAFAWASGEQGLDCSPLAGLRSRGEWEAQFSLYAGRSLATLAGPSAWAGGCKGFARALPAVRMCLAVLGRLRPGRWEKEPSSQGPRSGKAKRRLPFTLGAFLRDWTSLSVEGLASRPVRALTGQEALALSSAGRRTALGP